MPVLNVELLKPQYKGTWSSTQAYVAGDVVLFRKSLYSAKSATTGFAPQSDTSLTPTDSPWVLMFLDADTSTLNNTSSLGATSQGVLYENDSSAIKLSAGLTPKELSGTKVAVNYKTTDTVNFLGAPVSGANIRQQKAITAGNVRIQQAEPTTGVSKSISTGYYTYGGQSPLNYAWENSSTATFDETDMEGVSLDLVTFETERQRAGVLGALDTTSVLRGSGTPSQSLSYDNVIKYSVSASGSSAYTISGPGLTGTQSNPTITIRVNDRVQFVVAATGHPFYISTVPGSSWTSANATANTPAAPSVVAGQATQSGVVEFSPAYAGTYYYVCGNHPSSMAGSIVVTSRSDVRFEPASASRFQTAPMTKITDFNWPDGTAWTLPRWLDNNYSFQETWPYSQGPTAGYNSSTGIFAGITPDRKQIKVGGYNTVWHIPINHYSDQITTGGYNMDEANRRVRNLQYAQFEDPLRQDEYIMYVRSSYYSVYAVTNHGRLFQSGSAWTYHWWQDNYHFYMKAHPFFDAEHGRSAWDLQYWSHRNNFSNSSQIVQMVLTKEGQLWSWGYNGYGHLGDGTTTDRQWPKLVGGDGPVTSTNDTLQRLLSGTAGTTSEVRAKVVWYALGPSLKDGTAYAGNDQGEWYGWGYNHQYTLGDGTNNQRNTPVRLTSLESNISSIAAASRIPIDWSMQHNGSTDNTYRCLTIALLPDNHIYTAGLTSDFQDGTNNASQFATIATWTRANRPTGKTWVKMKAAGHQRSTIYAMTNDRFLYAWGANGYGQIGDFTTSARAVPTLVSGLPQGIQGNIYDFYPFGGGSGSNTGEAGFSSCLLRVRTWNNSTQQYTGTTDRWFWWGFGANSTSYFGRYSLIPVSGNTRSGEFANDTFATPFEITALLPSNGQGIVDVNIRTYGNWDSTIFITYDNGNVFQWGYEYTGRGQYPSEGGWESSGQLGMDTGTQSWRGYPRLVNQINNFI